MSVAFGGAFSPSFAPTLAISRKTTSTWVLQCALTANGCSIVHLTKTIISWVSGIASSYRGTNKHSLAHPSQGTISRAPSVKATATTSAWISQDPMLLDFSSPVSVSSFNRANLELSKPYNERQHVYCTHSKSIKRTMSAESTVGLFHVPSKVVKFLLKATVYS